MREAATKRKPESHPWRDRAGTAWEITGRPSSAGVDEGWVLRSEVYSFVVIVPVGRTRPADEALHRFLDRHHGRLDDGPRTARLWTDPRSGIEWEVSHDAGELVFRNGTEVVRSARGDGQPAPPDMSEEDLQRELDEAESGR